MFGDCLNIVAQIPDTITQSEQQAEAIVLVQKGAPHSLLLGTDLQPKLGLSLVLESQGKRMDLLRADTPPITQNQYHPIQFQWMQKDQMNLVLLTTARGVNPMLPNQLASSGSCRMSGSPLSTRRL